MLTDASSYGFVLPGMTAPDNGFAARQIRDNYNQDKLNRFRGTLVRMRRRAVLSEDPKQLAAYLQLANMMNVDPSLSAVGANTDRRARAENEYDQRAQAAQLFQSPMGWLNTPPQIIRL